MEPTLKDLSLVDGYEANAVKGKLYLVPTILGKF